MRRAASAPHRAQDEQEALRLGNLQLHRLAGRVKVGDVEGGATPDGIHDLRAAHPGEAADWQPRQL